LYYSYSFHGTTYTVKRKKNALSQFSCAQKNVSQRKKCESSDDADENVFFVDINKFPRDENTPKQKQQEYISFFVMLVDKSECSKR